MAGNSVVELNDTNFEEQTKTGVAVLDFWAPWCGPCKRQGPIIDQLGDALGDKAVIAKINVDDSPAIAAKFGIRSIPTIFVLKDSEVVEQLVGLQTLEQLTEITNKHLA